MSERKSTNFISTIDEELTEKEEGFDPKITGYQKKFIWASCRYCGKPHRIYGANFKKAGSACHKECRLKEQSEAGSPFANPDTKEKASKNRTKNVSLEEINKRISIGRLKAQGEMEKNNIEKHGVPNVAQVDEVKQKIKETNIKKYGTASAMKNPEIAALSAKRQKEEFIKNGAQTIEKRVASCIEKYGVPNPTQNPVVQKRKEDTCLSKYGVHNPMMDENVKLSSQQSTFDKYGVYHALQDESLLAKSKESFSLTVTANESGKFDNINLLRGDTFWDDMKSGFSINAICEKYDVDPAAIRFHLVQDEFRDKYYASYSFPKNQAQRKVAEAISSMGCSVLFNDRKALSGMELDIYIPDKNFAIEFNGSYWHSEAVLSHDEARLKHFSKTKMCKEKGIRLFHLFEKTWDNRQPQVLSFIRSALGMNQRRMMARNCEIRFDSGPKLIDDNHIQGSSQNTKKSFDLFHEGEWVGSMTAARHHRPAISEDVIVLSRLVFKENVTVAGGASKLFKVFKTWAVQSGFKKIVSWSDSLWTEGGIYRHLNFTLAEESSVDYFYWDAKSNSYISKQSQQKRKTGCPEDVTETEWAKQQKLYRIWDCGKKRWEMNI